MLKNLVEKLKLEKLSIIFKHNKQYEVKLRVMWDLVHQKFEDPELLSQLKAIKEPIIEHNWWHDNYWGICTCDKCRDVKATNWLGKMLENIKNS